MQWTSPAEFFAMGGYGLYVWGAYGVAAALWALEAFAARQRWKRALNAIGRGPAWAGAKP